MKEIKKILEGVYSNLELRGTIVPLFISNPGMAKSSLIYEFAREKSVNLVEIITSQISPFEVSGIAIPSHQKEKMVYYDFDRIDDLKEGDILFFDELLNGNPVVLNACLTLIESRKTISGKPLPKIMIVAAANPQNQVPLSPAIKERFVWYNISFNKSMWINYMIKKYEITREIGEKLSSLISKEDFLGGNNFYTPRSLDKAVNMLINDVLTPYSKIIKPILDTLITNPSSETIFYKESELLLSNESKSWLDIIKLKKEIDETIKKHKA
jgi:hypothetical protein